MCNTDLKPIGKSSDKEVMLLVQELDYPRTEQELRLLQDKLYTLSKQALANGQRPSFKGLLEVISSETVILTAIHKIKANHGSITPGSDGKVMRKDILEKDYNKVINEIQERFKNYRPKTVKRVNIPKPNKPGEMRPLGIPTIHDRIVQECVRTVIEPILEAQFFKHSYGFRPMRDAHMAIERANFIMSTTGYHWVIEGDISKFFDNVNHTTLLKKLYGMGIHDRRVLMITKAMLKAGIMNEIKENPLGTPQGGIISPLLANVYLNSFDKWITREWENKKVRHNYTKDESRLRALRNDGKLSPAYLIRYADDWILITNSKANAEKWKYRVTKYLKESLKLELSEEKTKITNVKKECINFLGFEIKLVKGKSKHGYITRTRPNRNKLKSKVRELRKDVKHIRKCTKRDLLIHRINLLNAKIRGIIQYYQEATYVNYDLRKHAWTLEKVCWKAIRKHGGKKIKANETDNLLTVHEIYERKIPAIEINSKWLGITSLDFCKFQYTPYKNPEETPYTAKGRNLYYQRTHKKQPLARMDDLMSISLSERIAYGILPYKYNFEYFLNRAYAFNRDRGKCKICGKEILTAEDLHTHHICKKLPIDLANRVNNLASTHRKCHWMIHDKQEHNDMGDKAWKKIQQYRERLG